ncbi:UDP-N-acetylglucosamine--N-acetylmuramyl-(pentapeptide) pyrophosphoryl-undecaprenol N-acetylglucosamine transferase [Candidatus Kaiserbacteria bacterium]|nr:UDP-N-acetylglucosamine--N-acetylmuramyl-(pentapeptide) pyrophosphoryl-undecaprenol N-acetylglucosamine transferase [Candidatus Kaiserbacteria bacterium]
MRIVLTGGGSGGHFYPLIAIAESIRENTLSAQAELYYMGPNPYNKESLDALNIKFVSCPSGKMRRYFSFMNFVDIFKVLFGFFIALFKLFWIYPDAIMSKGGYTTVPVVLAAWFLRIPVVVHESDVHPGISNKIGGRIAQYVAISWADTAEDFKKEKVAQTGIPFRKTLQTDVVDPKTQLGIDPNRPMILVLGGSSGAERVNTLVLESLDELLPNYTVIHQTGKGLYEGVVQTAEALLKDSPYKEYYIPAAFLDAKKMNLAYSAASLIVSRAGSGTIFEIAAHGKPSIIIPIPEKIAHDQRTNAYTYARQTDAVVMEEQNLADGLLAAEIARIMGEAALYESMSLKAKTFAPTDAAEKISDILRKIATDHE